MIYLIGGPPGGGKTTLGRALATASGGHSLTVDDIRTAMLGATTSETHPNLHVVGQPDAWTYFTNTSPEEMIEHAVAQHKAIWPAVLRVIRKRSADSEIYVIDGWHLIPSLVAGADLDEVTAVWLDVSHTVLENRERGVWDFYARSEAPDIMFANFLTRSTRWNDQMRDEAEEHGFAVLHQDGTKSVDALIEEIRAVTR